MRSLFWKIFLSFWAVVVSFIMIVVFIFSKPVQPPDTSWQRITSDAFRVEAQGMVQAYENGGTSELQRYIQQTTKFPQVFQFLVGPQGNELSGKILPSAASILAAQARAEGTSKSAIEGSEIFTAHLVAGRTGTDYVAVAEFATIRGPLSKPPSPLRDLAIALAISGVVCLLLARYLSAPIVRLRNAAQQLSGGNLSARAGKGASTGGDEINQLVIDFDVMAAQIETLVSAQQKLISDVSHEFRSPLTRINLAVELIRNVDSPAVAKAIVRIEQDTKSLNAMVGNLLTLSSIEARASQLDKKLTDLSRILKEIIDDTHFEGANCHRQVLLRQCDKCNAVCDARLFRSAVENIIRNAIRYTAENTNIEVDLTCNSGNMKPCASIRIRDHGPGVPEAALEQIFQPFFRLDESRERSTGGVGLGLAIARRAIELHGGQITAQNSPGGGLEIIISLPAAHTRTDSESQ